MNLLLNDKFAPMTSSIGFIQSSVKDVVDAYVKWMEPIQASRINYLSGEAAPVMLNVRHGYGSLPEMLGTLLPLTSVEHRRMLFIQTNSNWSAFIDNGRKGTDVFSVVSTLCEKLSCRGVRATCVPHTLSKQEGDNKGRYGATIFELYGARPSPILNIVRSIAVAHDGKWIFEASGKEQFFEEPEAYSAKKKKDRFTPEMLDRYLQALAACRT
jgi:hypothetical protein